MEGKGFVTSYCGNDSLYRMNNYIQLKISKMATSIYIKKKYHRLLDGNSFKINKVYNFYREGGLEVPQVGGGVKYVGKTFVNCPSRITDEVVIQGDEQLKPVAGESMSFREVIWNKDLKQREFHKYNGKLDKDFFSTYKKVYDVEIVIKDSLTLPAVWDSEAKAEVEKTFEGGVSATLNAFPVGRLKNLIESLDLDSGVQLVSGKDKAGNPAMVKPFDWEDGVKNTLEGKFVQMRVR